MFKSLMYDELKKMSISKILEHFNKIQDDPDLPFKFVEETLNTLPWSFNELSKNQGLEIWFLTKYFHHKNIHRWNKFSLSDNGALSIEFLMSNDIGLKPKKKRLSSNPSLQPEHLKIYETVNWDRYEISKRSDVLAFMPWLKKQVIREKYVLSLNLAIPFDYIVKNWRDGWDFNALSKRSDLTLDFIRLHLDKNWNMREMSENQVITEEFLLEHPKGLNEPWKKYLSWNPSISLKFMIDHPEFPWDFGWIELNPNITQEDIDKRFVDGKPSKFDKYLSHLTKGIKIRSKRSILN